MREIVAWISAVLFAYFFIALLFVEYGARRVVHEASERGELTSGAPRSYWSRLVWVKEHRSKLPVQAQALAGRVVVFDLSARLAIVLLFALYGVYLVAL